MYFLPTFHIPISKLDWIFIKTLYLHLNIFPSLSHHHFASPHVVNDIHICIYRRKISQEM
jgi:hypothetical protein